MLFLAEDLARGLPVLRSAQDELGGADRDRTDDLRLAKPALSQLSYSPIDRGIPGFTRPSEDGGPGWI